LGDIKNRKVSKELKQDTLKSIEQVQYFSGHSYHSDTLMDTTSFNKHIVAHAQSEILYGEDSTVTVVDGFYGIDVSFWQKKIDWEQVKKDKEPHHLSFYIIKATQGAHSVDKRFEYNWQNASSEKSIIGEYHFFTYKDDPKKQAQNYIKTVDLEQGNFRPIIDVELSCTSCSKPKVAKEDLVNNLKIFISEIESHYQVKPILYTYSFFYNTYLKADFSDYSFWMASYTQKPPLGFKTDADTSSQVLKPHVAMWQFTGSGKVNGIVGKVDMSYFPSRELDNLLIK
jgi:lysozyme